MFDEYLVIERMKQKLAKDITELLQNMARQNLITDKQLLEDLNHMHHNREILEYWKNKNKSY